MKRFIAFCFLSVLSLTLLAAGRLERIHGYKVLHLEGTAEQMGEQHGRLLRDETRRVLKALVGDATPEQLRKAMVMERHLPLRYRRELAALAKSAGVEYDKLVLLQLFGDVSRAPRCTSFAAFGPATRGGECIVGRNLDYWDAGASGYGSALIYYAPAGHHRFVTVTGAGIINGWTLMNEHGIVTSNNTGYGAADNSLEGISTCFMLRKVAEEAKTIEEGMRIVRAGPRACGTILLIARGTPPGAVVVEYDHSTIAVRSPARGVVAAANSFRTLYRRAPAKDDGWGRYATLTRLIRKHHGRIGRDTRLISAPGVPIPSINLHSAMLYPGDLTFAVSMGKTPACRQRYRRFRMTPKGVVSAEKGQQNTLAATPTGAMSIGQE